MTIDIDINSLSKEEFQKYKLIDIREPHEYAITPASTDNVTYIPFTQFPHNIENFNKNEQYLLFCAAGMRSHHMAAYLAQEGYQALSILYGVGAVNSYLEHNAG